LITGSTFALHLQNIKLISPNKAQIRDEEANTHAEIEASIKKRWAHCLEAGDDKDMFEYVNYAYNIEHLENTITAFV